MNGEFSGVWSEMWRKVWKKLSDHRDAPDDLFCELYRELERSFVTRLDPATELANIIDDQEQARVAFRSTKASKFNGEADIVKFLERAHDTLEDIGYPQLIDRYFELVADFIQTYSLRYELRRPFTLHPTLPGVFAKLFNDLRITTRQDASLNVAMHEFEESVRDLRNGQSSARIKTCIHKQMNLLEVIAGQCPGVTAGSLGGMCDQLHTWPHVTIREAMKKLYGFGSDYPGIRHGGNPASALRDIEMRDMVAVSVLLAGFAPYLSDRLDPSKIYAGGDT